MEPIRAANLFNVDGMVAVITGGGSGIGLIMARALAATGAAKVYIIGRREPALNGACASAPNTIIPLPGDVTSKTSLQAMSDRVKCEVGHVDLLVANAGMTGPTFLDLEKGASVSQSVRHARDAPMESFDEVYRLICTAVYYKVLAFLELLDAGNRREESKVKDRKSQVIVTASTASFTMSPRAGFAYTSSKAAVISMVKGLASFCVPWSVRFNAIAPGMRSARLMSSLSRAGAFCNGSIVLIDGGKLSIVPSTY